MIGRWAAELVEDGDSFLLRRIHQCLHPRRIPQDRKNLTVVTNGVETARRLARNPTNNVLLLGGLLRPDGVPVTGHVYGPDSARPAHQIAFVSAAGVTPDGGLTEGGHPGSADEGANA